MKNKIPIKQIIDEIEKAFIMVEEEYDMPKEIVLGQYIEGDGIDPYELMQELAKRGYSLKTSYERDHKGNVGLIDCVVYKYIE